MATIEAKVPVEFELFRGRAARVTGVDLTSYKAPQMHRRLSVLLTRLGIPTYADYLRVLEKDPERRQEFRDYVTINVSEFFRDAERFAQLENRVLPQLLKTQSALRVWSAGCSIGAEAYSISMLLHELAPSRPHSILASDIDQTILDRAKSGTGYTSADIRQAGTDRVRRWFTVAGDGRYSVSPSVRALVRFSKHDLLGDVYPAGPFDLLACRNVVIYFVEEAKERIFAGFVKSLRPGGVLFVGGTEAIMRPQLLGLSVLSPGFYLKQA
jgi:chemotaxis protein methyltransferase CheR